MASNGDLVTGFVRGRQNLVPQTCRHVILYLFFLFLKLITAVTEGLRL